MLRLQKINFAGEVISDYRMSWEELTESETAPKDYARLQRMATRCAEKSGLTIKITEDDEQVAYASMLA